MTLKRSDFRRGGSTAELSPSMIAKGVVRSAMASDLKKEPLLNAAPSVDRAYGLIQSVVCRHGSVIQQMLGDHLSQDERFEVFKNHPIPVSASALECVASSTPVDVLRRMSLGSSGAVHHVVCVDLFVVHLRRGWTGVFDCKRGWSPTACNRRREIEIDLRALRMTLPDLARRMGFSQVDLSTSAVIDFYGNAGFSEDLTLYRDDVDGFFGLPLVGKIVRTTAALKKELGLALGEILGASSPETGHGAQARRLNGKVVSLFGERPPAGSDPDTSERR